jgi:hypothetical protein
MGTVREVDAISDAIIATEREIAGDAWGQEETDALDETGDRSLEDIGGGLEGQHEAEDAEDSDGEEAEGDEDSEAGDGEGQTEAEVAAAAAAAAQAGKTEPPEGGRVPSGKLREANEARRAAEAERDALKAEIEKSKGDTTQLKGQLDLVMREINDLKRGGVRTEPPKPAEPKAVPDIFEDPKGFVEHITQGFQSELSKRDAQQENMRVETSMAIAHAFHKDGFEKAFEAINKLNPQNPDDRVTVQRIYRSPNPGEALVAWHKRSQTLAEVGDDPAAYRERIAKETREALMNDPEFKKQLVAELRGDAARGDNGSPRTETRLPKSLHRAGGSNLGAERSDPRASDGSEQAVADAAWR